MFRLPRRLSTVMVVSAALVGISIALRTDDVAAQSGTPYDIADLGTLGGGAASGHDVGEYGQFMVGQAQTSTGVYHAFVQGRPGLRDLGTLGGTQSAAFVVTGGFIAGQAETASGEMHAFSYSVRGASGMVDLGTLGGSWSAAYGATYGMVVGASKTAGDARLQAFAHLNGSMSPLALDWGGDSVAKSVAGDLIVGYACTPDNASCHAFAFRIRHAFRYANGVMTDLGTLGGRNSEGLDINARGERRRHL